MSLLQALLLDSQLLPKLIDLQIDNASFNDLSLIDTKTPLFSQEGWGVHPSLSSFLCYNIKWINIFLWPKGGILVVTHLTAIAYSSCTRY